MIVIARPAVLHGTSFNSLPQLTMPRRIRLRHFGVLLRIQLQNLLQFPLELSS
jgi:hypothetical protein